MDDPVLRAPSPHPGPRAHPTRLPILVVDDDPACVRLSAALLRMLGYPADSAANGEEALQVFDPSRHEVVVTDNEMEPIRGTELALRIKAKSPGTLIIMCSGRPPANAEGIDGVITKPLDAAKLKSTLEQVLGVRGAPKPLDSPASPPRPPSVS